VAAAAAGADSEAALDPAVREQAVEVLRTNLAQEARWVKVHAAEFLLELGYPEGVYETFDAERIEHGDTPLYRIGIWRVLAKASTSPDAYRQWVDKIREALRDPDGPDRLHATETLSKLPYQATAEEQAILEEFATSDDEPIAAFAACMLVHAGREAYESTLKSLLLTEDDRTRQCAAYALRHIEEVPWPISDRLSEVASLEPADTLAGVYLHAAAYSHAPDDAAAAPHREAVLNYARTGKTNEQYEATAVLAQKGTEADIPLLVDLLEDDDQDV